MGHVVDRWTVPGPSGRRVKGPRHGRGKRWLARWVEPDGRERSKAFASRDAAEAHLAKVSVDIRGGSYVAESRESFEVYAKRWLSHQVHQSPGTASKAESVLRVHAYPAFGAVPVQRVTRRQVQDLVADVSGSGGPLGATATGLLYAYVQAVFAAAVEDRLISASPCRGINLPRGARRKPVPLTVPRVAGIAAAVPERLAAMVWVGAGSGLRPGELKSLTVDRVEGGVLRVDRQLTDETTADRLVWGPLKTEASDRSVPLAAVTAKRLLEHLERFPPGRHGLVFATSRGTWLTRARLSTIWGQATDGMGLPERSGWHDLRHHHASLLIAAGLSPRAVADRLGHADPSETLATYSHLWPSDEGRILAAIEDAHGVTVGGADGPGTDQKG